MSNSASIRDTVDVLKKSIISDDISKVYDALVYLNENVQNETDEKILYEWAQVLTDINLNNSADLQLLYAVVFYHLYNWKKKKTFPDWRSWKAPKVVEVTWRQLEIYLELKKVDFNNPDEITLQALFDLDTRKISQPEDFFEKICEIQNIRIQSIALKLIRQSIDSYTTLTHQAYTCILKLCKGSNFVIIKDALELLSEAWAQSEEYPLEVVEKALFANSIQVRMSAVKALEVWQNFDKLEIILKNDSIDHELRCMAMKTLGKSKKKELISYILSISAQDSMGFGEACFTALEYFHHSGIFIKEEHLDNLITVFVQNTQCSPEIFEMLTFTCREQLVEKISFVEESFEIWSRLSIVIPLIQITNVKDVVIDLLKRTKVSSIKAILLRLLGDVGGIDDEDTVLSYLEEYSKECLFALKHIGSTKTIEELWMALGVQSNDPYTYYYLLPYQEEALTVLWHLCDDERRKILKSKLNPAILPAEIIKDIVPSLNKDDLRLLLFKKDELSVQDLIPTLCKYGNVETIDEISELFYRHVSEVASNRFPKESNSLEYQIEAVAAESIRASIIKFGENLFKRGKIRPVYFLKAKNAAEAGEILLSEIVFEILDKKTLSINEIRILLEVIENLRHYILDHRMRKLIRNKEPQIRKMVVRCLVKQHAIGYTFDILRLLESDDMETRRQAIIAMEEFNAVWASSYVVKNLEHPNMNIKKASAKALIKIGDYKGLKRLIFWIGYHDNPEFRQLLLSGLESIAGPSYLSHLLKELEASIDERKTELLLSAFDGNINIEFVKNIIRNKYKCSTLILNALIEGIIRLSCGSISELLNHKSKLYKDSFEKLIRSSDLTKINKKTSNALTNITNSLELSHKDELLNLLKSNMLSESQTEFIILHYLREWLDVINKSENISNDNFEIFLLVAEKSFGNSHYEVLADNVFVLFKMHHSNELSFDMEQKYFNLLCKVIVLLKKPIVIKVADTIRNTTFIKCRGNDWTYRLLKLCNCILLDTDIYNAFIKIDNLQDRMTLLKDAYQLQNFNLESYDKIVDELLVIDETDSLKYGEIIKYLIESISKDNVKDSECKFTLLNNLLPLNMPAWIFRKNEESNKDIEIKKICANKEKDNKNMRHENRLLELLNNPDFQTRQDSAVEILNRKVSVYSSKKVLESYLEGKINPIEVYMDKIRKAIPLLPKEWYMEQIKIRSRDWILRLLDLTSKIDIYNRKEYVSWLYALWQSEDRLISAKAFDCLVDLSPLLLVYESINYHRLNRSLGINMMKSIQDYDEICKQLSHSRLIGIGLHTSLLLSKDAIGKLIKDYKDLHEPVESVNINAATSGDGLLILIDDIQSNDISKILSALKEIATFKETAAIDAVTKLLEHKNSKVRSASHRCLRQIVDKESYLMLTCKLLYDSRIGVQRSAIRTLSYAKFEPAIPAIIDLLGVNNPKLREIAADGLKTYGTCTIQLLRKAEKKARPDQQQRYREIVEYILKRA
ncbi:HEAT repeat domain-containing protein [Pseudobacteroides cellulosolvens]|uniref:PBS lyase HEAT domain protein repeat-containing protein n=1 Tax=Pseudobacteroides cellulosolvens ATCC 35603 = DSM 2933 TaxID=398512 RepID=A0A0L6JPN0_9FIRM|nr:HEAT repeat domain-containing protein [Pseudobacteroides cellulosolvens]KNY27791.1 hypothetical protein Bccel_3062 [Pseudobacteroides cellulosolvens ATCC 35603 = DSM 2933]